jgi:hypothetical protein
MECFMVLVETAVRKLTRPYNFRVTKAHFVVVGVPSFSFGTKQ